MLTRKQHELLSFIDRHLKESGVSPSFEEMKEALNLRSKSGIHRLISALEERGFLRRHHHRARALEVMRLPENYAEATQALSPLAQSPLALAQPAPAQPVLGQAAAPAGQADAGFAPTVIHGDFSRAMPGVRAANDASAVQLPLYGRIAAGLPIEALRDDYDQIDVPLALLGNGEHFALEVAGDSMIEAGILDGDTVIIRKGDVAENGQIVVALVDDNEVTLKRLRKRGNSVALEPANARYETKLFPADRVRIQGRLVALMRSY